MKWLKMFIFHAIIHELYPLYSVCLNINQKKKKKTVTKTGRLKRWWHFSKRLTITITSFNFLNCPVKS